MAQIQVTRKNITETSYESILFLPLHQSDKLIVIQVQYVIFEASRSKKISFIWQINENQFQIYFATKLQTFYEEYNTNNQLYINSSLNKNKSDLITLKFQSQVVTSFTQKQWKQQKSSLGLLSKQKNIPIYLSKFNRQKKISLNNYRQIHSIFMNYSKLEDKIDKFERVELSFLLNLIKSNQTENQQLKNRLLRFKRILYSNEDKIKKMKFQQQNQCRFDIELLNKFDQQCKQNIQKLQIRRKSLNANKFKETLNQNLSKCMKYLDNLKKKKIVITQSQNNLLKQLRQIQATHKTKQLPLLNAFCNKPIRLSLFLQTFYSPLGLVYNHIYMICEGFICKIKNQKGSLVDTNNPLLNIQLLKNRFLKFQYLINVQKCSQHLRIGVCSHQINQLKIVFLDVFDGKIYCNQKQSKSFLQQTFKSGVIKVQVNLTNLQIVWKQVNKSGEQLFFLGISSIKQIFQQQNRIYPYFQLEENDLLSI